MDLLSELFRKKSIDPCKPSGEFKTTGELIAEVTDGASLVRGRQTWEWVEGKKDDLQCMKECCEAELQTMEITGIVPAPFYFERVAILSRKEKNYAQEVSYCEKYIAAVNALYRTNTIENLADVRKGPRFQAIVKRLPKAMALLVRGCSSHPPATIEAPAVTI